MAVEFLREVFSRRSNEDAIVWRSDGYRYGWLKEELDRWIEKLSEEGVPTGSVVSLEADFSPRAVSLLLALVAHRCIVVPLTRSVEAQKPEFREISQVEVQIVVNRSDNPTFLATGVHADHAILHALKEQGRPGLVLFSSGSTGKSKAAVHDVIPMLEKFRVPRHRLRSIAFLLFDHIGGFNTLLYSLSNGGCLVTVQDRRPDSICRTIEEHRVQLLPTSPTFLNLLLVSEAYRRHDLSSLETVTYGTEVMPQSTLERCHQIFPGVRLLQTYGLSEVGILRSQSKSSDSLWVRVGGEGFETRVVDGLLEIRATSAMLGYLNAPSPFTEDGWFKTGDVVEVDGEYLRILGRQSEIINVGGEKVYPADVEGVLQQMPGVTDAVVQGEAHLLTGQIVKARVRLNTDETLARFRKRMRQHCRGKLARFKIPQKVELAETDIHGERFKKIRRP